MILNLERPSPGFFGCSGWGCFLDRGVLGSAIQKIPENPGTDSVGIESVNAFFGKIWESLLREVLGSLVSIFPITNGDFLE